MRLSYLVDIAGISAVAAGLGYRFGWWAASVVGGSALVAANWVRSS